MMPPIQDDFSNLHQRIAEALAGDGFIIIDNALTPELVSALEEEFKRLSLAEFKAAGVGRTNELQINTHIRRDKIHWLEANCAPVTEFLTFIEQLRISLNRQLFLGLREYESHFSFYCINDFYLKHFDAFRGNPGRKISTVLYLNQAWRDEDGGHLCIYDAQEHTRSIAKVAPQAGRLVVFLSEDFPHEVLPASRLRRSIAGWFRI
jgi:SM-20-related protein